MNCKEKLVVDALLEQLSTAHNWKVSYIRAPFLPRIRPPPPPPPRMEERKEGSLWERDVSLQVKGGDFT